MDFCNQICISVNKNKAVTQHFLHSGQRADQLSETPAKRLQLSAITCSRSPPSDKAALLQKGFSLTNPVIKPENRILLFQHYFHPPGSSSPHSHCTPGQIDVASSQTRGTQTAPRSCHQKHTGQVLHSPVPCSVLYLGLQAFPEHACRMLEGF